MGVFSNLIGKMQREAVDWPQPEQEEPVCQHRNEIDPSVGWDGKRHKELAALTVPVANRVENPDAVMVEVQHQLPVEENKTLFQQNVFP